MRSTRHRALGGAIVSGDALAPRLTVAEVVRVYEEALGEARDVLLSRMRKCQEHGF